MRRQKCETGRGSITRLTSESGHSDTGTQVRHPVTEKIYRMTISNPVLGKPIHPLAKDGGAIYPRECREMVDLLCQPSHPPITLPAAQKLTYAAPLHVDVVINRIRVTVG